MDEWLLSPPGLAYNIPITLVFLVLAADLAVATCKRGFRSQFPYLIVWGIGLLLLVLRVGFDAIPVSGHMTWLVLMVTHCILRGLPRWLTCLAFLTLLQAAYFNFVLFPQQVSGAWGLVAGLVLSSLLFWIVRRGNVAQIDQPSR